MKLNEFKEMINRTIFAADIGIAKSVRFIRKTRDVYLEKKDGNLIMVATNKHRLGYVIRFAGNEFPDFEGILIPAPVLQKIAKRKRDTVPFAISVTDKEAVFHIGSAEISSVIISGKSFLRFHRNPE